jgi:hypothetical protein
MLALIALYVMRPPFIGTAEEPDDEETIVLRRELAALEAGRAGPIARQAPPRPVGAPLGCLDAKADPSPPASSPGPPAALPVAFNRGRSVI